MSFTLNAVAQAKGSHSNTGANDSAEPLNTTRSRSRTPGAKGGVSPTSSHPLFSREKTATIGASRSRIPERREKCSTDSCAALLGFVHRRDNAISSYRANSNSPVLPLSGADHRKHVETANNRGAPSSILRMRLYAGN